MAGPFTSKQLVAISNTNTIGAGIASYTAVTTPLPAVAVSYSVAHALGVVPSSAELEITCITAEFNYSIGDVVQVRAMSNTALSTYFPLSSYKTAAVVGIPITTDYAISLTNKTTGSIVRPTPANWSYRFELRKD